MEFFLVLDEELILDQWINSALRKNTLLVQAWVNVLEGVSICSLQFAQIAWKHLGHTLLVDDLPNLLFCAADKTLTRISVRLAEILLLATLAPHVNCRESRCSLRDELTIVIVSANIC